MELVRELAAQVSIPVFAEGRISTPEQIKLVMDAGGRPRLQPICDIY